MTILFNKPISLLFLAKVKVASLLSHLLLDKGR